VAMLGYVRDSMVPTTETTNHDVGLGFDTRFFGLAILRFCEFDDWPCPQLMKNPKEEASRRATPVSADSGPSRTVIPTHCGQRSGDCGQLLMSV
jgi:hypothetical protein